MSIEADEIFFEACRSIGGAFVREANADPRFNDDFNKNKDYWFGLTNGLLLTTFCHLVEVHYGEKDSFKQTLSSPENKEILDALFYARNAFIHCKWDISKLQYENQEKKLRNITKNGKFSHPTVDFQLWLENDILKIDGLEPMCRVLLRNKQ